MLDTVRKSNQLDITTGKEWSDGRWYYREEKFNWEGFTVTLKIEFLELRDGDISDYGEIKTIHLEQYDGSELFNVLIDPPEESLGDVIEKHFEYDFENAELTAE